MCHNILVSICCVTFNHKDYISQALDGFLMQKTSFPFEVIVCDDASTDGTTEIIKEYEKKFPKLIKGVYQKENQYSQGILPYPTFAWPLAKGKYIALCEGDDFWTDPLKLQKQVDFLEQNPDYIACAHESIIRYDACYNLPDIKCSTAKLPYSENKKIVHHYTFNEVAKTVLFQSSTLIFRNVTSEFPAGCRNNQLWDVALFHFLAGKGKIFFMNDVMSVYRKHPDALTMYGDTWQNRFSFVKNMLLILNEINDYFKKYYNKTIKQKEIDYYLELWLLNKIQGNRAEAVLNLKAAKERKAGQIIILKRHIIFFNKYFKNHYFIVYHKVRRTIRQTVKKGLIFFGLFKEKNR